MTGFGRPIGLKTEKCGQDVEVRKGRGKGRIVLVGKERSAAG
jgi:hypothetical protein